MSASPPDVTQHLGLVHLVARSLHRRVADHVEYDDLVGAGVLGLLHAARSFEASRGLSFSTYAMPRIRGAILDDFRRKDTASRGTRRRKRQMTTAHNGLQQRLGRLPTQRELAATLDISVDQLDTWRRDIAAAYPVDVDEIDLFTTMESPEAAVERESNQRSLSQLLLRVLNAQQRHIVLRHYVHGEKLRDIADALGLTESRVCQVRATAIAKLRQHLPRKAA